MAIFPILMFFFDYDIGWNWETFVYADFYSPQGIIRNLFFNGFHPVFPWTAFLLFGMWLGRQDIAENPIARKKILYWSLGIVIFAELTSWFLIQFFLAHPLNIPIEDMMSLMGTEQMPPMPLYMLASGGTAVIVICLSIILLERFNQSSWVNVLTATGQLSLTLYVAHIVIGLGVLRLLGQVENQRLPFAVICAVSFCGISILFSSRWKGR